MKHRFLVYVTLFIISFTAAFYFNLHHPIFVELRNEGFYPSELTIAKGEEVIFVNKTNRSFWPASNPHPTHTIYSIFDSQKPVNPGKSWSFRFEKTGIFNYHDHLSPSFHGKIIVGDIETMPISQNECLKMKQPEQRTCFEDLLDKTLKTKGLDEGFKLFRELAKIAPNDCHQYAHNLGEYAFKTNVVGRKEIKAGPETSYCGYGFWHGFMGEMLASTDFNNATQFCETQIISAPELSR